MEFISAFEASDTRVLKSTAVDLPTHFHSLKGETLLSLCKCMRQVKDYPRLLPYSMLQTREVYTALVEELERSERDLQISICLTLESICDPETCKSLPGSPAYAQITSFLLKSHNEDACLSLLQTLSAYQRSTPRPDLEPVLYQVITRLLRDCSYDPLIFKSFDLLLFLLGNRSECSLKTAYEAEIIPILLIYIGNPSGEIKQRTMTALLAFKDAPYAVEPLATQGIGNLMSGLVCFTDLTLRKMTVDILTAISAAKAEYRDSLITHNFAPICISLLTSQDAALKPNILHLLSLILHDHQKQHIDELVENNLISVLCRIIQREDGLRGKALECVEEILDTGGVDGMYKAIMKECQIIRMLINLRNSQEQEVVERILRKHFPNKAAAPSLKPSGFNPSPGLLANAQLFPVPLPPRQAPVPPTPVPPQPPVAQPVPPPVLPQTLPATSARPTKGKLPHRRHRKTMTLLSGLVFPVPKLYRRLRLTGYKVSRRAAVFLTGALEYVAAEVLECSGRVVKNNRRRRIQPVDIRDALRGDEELDRLTKKVLMPCSEQPTK